MDAATYTGFTTTTDEPGLLVVVFTGAGSAFWAGGDLSGAPRSIYLAAEQTWAHALEDIAARTAVTDHLPDAAEGARAFREKRPARFNAELDDRRQPG